MTRDELKINEHPDGDEITVKEGIPGKNAKPATDVLKFLLPGLCHLTTEESARKVFLQEKGHTLLAQYFNYLTEKLSSQEAANDIEV